MRYYTSHAGGEKMEGRYVGYIRVSTQKQGLDGYGVDAQKKAIEDYLNGGSWELLGLYEEVESGKNSSRPQLHAALEHCKRSKATLIISKLDRLSRNAAFLLTLLDSGVDIICVDNPHATKLTIGIMAVIAEDEARRISTRTREALQAAKRKNPNLKLGNPQGFRKEDSDRGRILARQAKTKLADEYAERMYPIIKKHIDEGMSLRWIAKEMERQKELTPRGGERWTPTTVRLIINRVENKIKR
jgi:DNA invertase Pin-like site-specific DNA recombinase